MPTPLEVRLIARNDYDQWRPLWDDYNAFYGRVADTALPEPITATTWERFFDPNEPVFALVAIAEGQIVGLTHYLFHRSTTKIEPVCYLQDLFSSQEHRRAGVGRALIEGVYEQARMAGAKRVYWQTHLANMAGRALYDKVAKHLGFIVYTCEPV